MGTQVCAVVESNSTPTQKDSSNTDGVFYLFFNKKCNLCYSWVKMNNNTSGICHSRRCISKCSAMEYQICVVVKSDSTTTQRWYFIADDVLLGVLQCEIWIVLLLTQAVVDSESTTTQV